MKRILSLFLICCLLAALVPCGLPQAAATEPVIYDAASVPRFQRSRQQVADAYNAALLAAPGYSDGSAAGWYVRPASTSAPYDQGEVTQDTLDAMVAMTNYVRWLAGTEPLTAGCQNDDSLQRQALIRNFDFNHYVNDKNKPADMDQDFWDAGAVMDHNILAMGYSPRGSILGWCNEGYRPASQSWDTVGHRYCLIASDVSGESFGYAGRVSIGRMTGHANSMQLPFAAFPAPGPMPAGQLNAQKSAWSLEPNYSLLQVPDGGALTVTVTDAAGVSYDCTLANGKLKYNTWAGEIDFVQPACSGNAYPHGAVYQVRVTGLKDRASGSAAELRYQVEFFDMTDYELTTVSSATVQGWNLLNIPTALSDAASLEQLRILLPDTVTVQTVNGRQIEVPLLGDWTLDTANQCWTAQADAALLPATVTDPEGILSAVTVGYQIVGYTGGMYFLNGNPALGRAGGFKVWRYMQGLEHLDLWQLRPQGSGWSAVKRFDESSEACGIDDDGYVNFSLDAWRSSDNGSWIALYYGSSYYKEAWVAGRLTVDLPCDHSSTRQETQAPGCTESGWTRVICQLCGQVLSETAAPALGHDYGAWTEIKAPSCTESGLEDSVCARCGTEVTREIPALGHSWDAGVVIRGATEEEEGERLYTCVRCGQTRTEVIPRLTPFRFEDVQDPSWYYYAPVYWAVQHRPQITNGTDPTHFSPNTSCTRAQVVTFLWRALGQEAPTITSHPFQDVEEGWYYDAVLWAVEKGVTNGTDATHFNPELVCTRDQVVRFLWNAMDKPRPADADNPFVDVEEEWYYDAVLWAVEKGITTGTDDSHFSPRMVCSRAQVVTFLYRMLGGQ